MIIEEEDKFSGYAKMYNEIFYVDTTTGEGIDKVLKKIDPLLCGYASKTYLASANFDDIKHELIIITINGIKKYDPTKEVALSTFLHEHIKNKLISKLRNNSKLSRHSNIFKLPVENDYGYKVIEQELSFGELYLDGGSSRGKTEEKPINKIPDDGRMESFSGAKKITNYEESTFRVSVEKILKDIHPTTAEIIRLVCFEDYSIKDAGAKVGLPHWAANNRIKNMAKNVDFKRLLLKKYADDEWLTK